MDMNPEKFAMGEMFHSDPMDFENVEEVTVEKKNGSKGNHTGMRVCYVFKFPLFLLYSFLKDA